MTTVSPDVDPILDDPNVVELESGFKVAIQRLKTRQLFKLLKILTNGGAELLTQIRMPTADDDEGEFAGQLLGLVIMAIPNAEEEGMEFIRSMVLPADYVEDPRNAGEKQLNKELVADLLQQIYNPEILDTLAIITKIVEIESKDIQRLGKQLVAIFRTVRPAAVKNESSTTSDDSTPTDS